MRPARSFKGKAVELKPGGYHLMLLDLNRKARTGDTNPLSLVIEGKDGPRETVKASAVARHALTLWERYAWNAQWKTGAGVYVQGARFAGVVSV
jgi:hypothetical protein